MAEPILIFGAHGGIGEALARRLASEGRPLFLTGRSRDTIAPLAEEIGAGYAICDVFEPSSIRDAVGAAAEDGLAGLAYCVGSIDIKPLKSATADDFARAVHLNAVGAALALQAAHGALARAKGSAVLFSTVAAQQGFPHHSVISLAKGAVEGLVRSVAAEWAPDVRVNAVAPSLTRTPLAAQITENETYARSIASLHALSRLGEPEDVAALAAFLLGPDSSWITGQVIGVDGGRSTLRTKG